LLQRPNLRLAAVRRVAYEAADTGLLSPDLAAGIRRVKGAKKIGMRLRNWLTVEQSRSLLRAPYAESLKGGGIGPFLHSCSAAGCAKAKWPTCG
jgi:hypothetical protein